MGPKDEALRSALERCENEPIRIPGNIQDFGYLLVLDENFEIIEVSENLDKIIEDIHSLANLPLSEFIDRDYVKKLKANLLEGELNPIRHTEVKIQTSSHSGVYDAMIHKAGDKIILELEEKVNTADEQFVYNIYAQLMAFNNKLQMTETKDELYQHLVETFRSVTGLDRVKLYAFDDEWNGEIVAEEKEPFMNSYMGLHFPSSDIPAQARELYKSNYLRIIYDIDAKPSPLVNLIEGKKEIETDLSHAVLRSVSPIHLQYLKNMGVQASMSVSLLQKGELWGMIVAHHNTSYKPPYQIRMIADLIGQNFSAFLTSHAEKSRLDLEKVISTSLSEMEKALRQPGSLSQMLKDNEKLLLSIVKADGVLACLNNTCYIFGKVPKLDQLSSFISWLEENHTDECFQTNQFGKELPDGIRETLDTCGLMITPVSSRMSDYLVWFRDEKVKKTNWAGKHEKNVKKDSVGYYLTPRASFSRYVEEHRGISEEWANEEVITAKFLSKIILNRHHEGEIERVSEDLNDFIKHSTSAIYITSKSGVIAKVNETFAQLVNKSVVKLTGTRLSDHFRADVCEQHFEQIDKLAQEQETNTFKFHHTQAGVESDLITSIIPMYDVNKKLTLFCFEATDITQLTITQSKLNDALANEKILNREIQHRTKNNLQMIAGINRINMMRHKYSTEAKEAMDELNRMTLSICRAYDLLFYNSKENTVALQKYLQELANATINLRSRKSTKLEYSFDQVTVPLDTAVSIGLMVYETLTGYTKHGNQSELGDFIKLSGRKHDKALELDIESINNTATLSNENTEFGQLMVSMLAEQLEGNVRTTVEKNSHRTKIIIPLN